VCAVSSVVEPLASVVYCVMLHHVISLTFVHDFSIICLWSPQSVIIFTMD